MSDSKPFTVAIIGGGIVGVVLTLALSHRNVNVQLYERNGSLSEVAAGMGINASAAEALKICGPAAYQAMQEVLTAPPDPEVGLKFVDGYNNRPESGWTVPWDGVFGGVHRGEFLSALVKQLPEGAIHFNSRLDTYDEGDGKGPIKISFTNGTTAEADAVVGADGIGSHVRRHLLGEHHPSTRAQYAHSYVYRALVDTKDAAGFVDAEYTQHTTMWLGKDCHVVTVPVTHGQILGVTAVVRDSRPWPDQHHMILPATKEDVVSHFTEWNPQIRALLDTIKPGVVDRWALFDLAENPVPYYAKGRVALAGDSAHATTPHLGSGAMTGIEDAAVLAELLADEKMQGTPEQLEAAFDVYSHIRLARGHSIPELSRQQTDLYDFKHPEAEDDMVKIEPLAMKNFHAVWSKPIQEHVRMAKEKFASRLQAL